MTLKKCVYHLVTNYERASLKPLTAPGQNVDAINCNNLAFANEMT